MALTPGEEKQKSDWVRMFGEDWELRPATRLARYYIKSKGFMEGWEGDIKYMFSRGRRADIP